MTSRLFFGIVFDMDNNKKGLIKSDPAIKKAPPIRVKVKKLPKKAK